jgi:hypothetical protein
VRYVHRACLDRWRLAAGINSDNAGRCEICHAEYAFVPDLAAALRFRLRIFAVCLNFALWGSVLAWVVQALLLLSPDIENAYGLKRGLPLGKALVVGWYALFGLLGAVTILAILARATGLLLVLALVFFDQLGDFIVYAVCSWGVTVVCALVGFLSFAQIARFYLQQACHGRDRSLRVVDLDATRPDTESPEP